jgi:preprotein translocase SecE subunit
MALGIYKPGQGYWVRVLTATLIAIVTLAAAGWITKQMQLVADKLPRSVWVVKMEKGLATPPAQGESVTLYKGKAPSEGPGEEVAHATVASYSTSAKELRIRDVKLSAGALDPGEAKDGGIKIGSGERVNVSGALLGEPAIEPALLQGLAAAVMLVIGAGLAYWATAMNQRFVDFLIATDGEMKKVNWSTARDIRMSTLVVIFASLVLSLSLFVVDVSFQWIFTKAGILVH